MARGGAARGEGARGRGAGVALIAELARMARGAARADGRARSGTVTGSGQEVRGAVRRGRGKPGNVGAGQACRLDERHVTGGAGGVGRRQVRRAKRVTIEAALDHRLAHRHASLALQRVTAFAARRLVTGVFRVRPRSEETPSELQ